jgi:predicted methyltransferase
MITFQTSIDILNSLTSNSLWSVALAALTIIRLYIIEKQFKQLKEYQLANTVASFMLIKKLQEKGILTEEELGIKLEENGQNN